MKIRESLGKLLAHKADTEIAKLDGQPGTPMSSSVGGPWVCVDFEDGECFAIWKHTGDVYRLDAQGAVEEDPLGLP